MWWFAATHANLLLQYRLARPRQREVGSVLDAGCGTGGLLSRFATEYPADQAFGMDADPGACERAAAKCQRPVCAGSVNDMPFGDTRFSAIFSADVLCHAGVDEYAALGQFHEALMAPSLDRAQIESLRAAQVKSLDDASKRLVTAIEDAAEVLSPEQRAALGEEIHKHHSD